MNHCYRACIEEESAVSSMSGVVGKELGERYTTHSLSLEVLNREWFARDDVDERHVDD